MRVLSDEARDEGIRAGLASGRFRFQQHSIRIKCTMCGRTGFIGGPWVDQCLLGHIHVCACGKAFATHAALLAHRRMKLRKGITCHA